MSDDQKSGDNEDISGKETGSEETRENDSFNIPVKKSPLFIYALLQIPLLLIMVIILYFVYQSSQN